MTGRILLLLSVLCLMGSCSDDFLDNDVGQQTSEVTRTDLYITTSTGYYEYTVSVPNAGNAAYSIGLYPKWLVFKYLRGSFENDTTILKFTVQNVPASFESGTYESVLTLVVEGVGIHTISIYFVNE